MLYKIKIIATYKIEADSHEEAIDYYDSGLWDQSDLFDETVIELGYTNDTGDYVVLREDLAL